LGWEYIDDENDSAAEKIDDDYFFAATAIHTGPTVVRKTNAATRPKRLEKDAYLIGTLGGGAQATAFVQDAIVFGRFVGAK
jgi:hypothetical protein